MGSDSKEIIDTIINITNDFWEKESRPLLLSNLPGKLKEGGIEDYKTIIKNESLKDFLEKTESDKTYKLVKHKNQKAKLGLIPAKENFDFSNGISGDKKKTTNKISNKIVVDFFKSLSKLSDDELDSIVIPTRILVKLINDL